MIQHQRKFEESDLQREVIPGWETQEEIHLAIEEKAQVVVGETVLLDTETPSVAAADSQSAENLVAQS